ncbi:MAG: hypothetical protein ACYSTT_04825 [Planctomycetota bacterium]|jgi:hypothetical protein
MKRLVIVMIGAMLVSTPVLAFDLIGPTTSRLKQSGKSSVGVEYFWSSMEIDADGISDLDLTSDTIEDFEIDKITVNLALGMGRGSEIFFRFGVAEADPDNDNDWGGIPGNMGSSDEALVLGGGAKWTLYDDNQNFRWGLVTQMSWADYDFDGRSYSVNGHNVALSPEFEIFEIQIVTGPEYNLTEEITIFGGPFLYFLTGDADFEGLIDGSSAKVSADLEQESILGGYIGAGVALGQKMDLAFEVQATSGSYGVGGQFIWKF